MKVDVIFSSPLVIQGRRYRQGEFAELEERYARPLLAAGTVEHADGRPVAGRMVDGEGHEIRAFGASVPHPVPPPAYKRRRSS
jgi:hypothetical protein